MSVAQVDEMNEIRTRLGIAETLIPVTLFAADLDAESLREFVQEGAVDMEKLDSGEQILVYAPSMCMTEEDGRYFSDNYLLPGEIREEDWDLVVRNDAFTAGMGLNLLEMTGRETESMSWNPSPDEIRAYYRNADAALAKTEVGAVLAGPLKLSDTYVYSFALITTPKGAEALGLTLPNPEYVNIFLSGDPTAAEEAGIEEKISQTALRGWMDMENQLELTREYNRKKLNQMLLFAALILLFFAVSVFMQVSGTSRQIRAETRRRRGPEDAGGLLPAAGLDLRGRRPDSMPRVLCDYGNTRPAPVYREPSGGDDSGTCAHGGLRRPCLYRGDPRPACRRHPPVHC